MKWTLLPRLTIAALSVLQVSFNEPHSFVVEGYDSGKSAPGCVPFQPGSGRCVHGETAVYIVAHNVLNQGSQSERPPTRFSALFSLMAPHCVLQVLNAHAAAAAVFHSTYQPRFGGTLSMTLNCEMSIPASGSAADAAAAERANEFMLGWWLQPLLTGEYPMARSHSARAPTAFTPTQCISLTELNCV
jgi:hypothetical protein